MRMFLQQIDSAALECPVPLPSAYRPVTVLGYTCYECYAAVSIREHSLRCGWPLPSSAVHLSPSPPSSRLGTRTLAARQCSQIAHFAKLPTSSFNYPFRSSFRIAYASSEQ
jgi:hypothetical protein